LDKGTYANRRWAGSPGDVAHHAAGAADTARIRTRFPPEPNGYLHIGHAKSICLNFGLAREYGGVCHMRFDDTNPEKEEQEYVDSILDAVKWLGFGWETQDPLNPGATRSHLFYASNYFDFMYRAAEALITPALPTSTSRRPSRCARTAATSTRPAQTARSAAARLKRTSPASARCATGNWPMARRCCARRSTWPRPNINLRDPAIYRIKRATHHNTGDTWCIYPMYTYAHPIEDALENITHSICTLEFEDQRPFYDWLLDTLCKLGLTKQPRPHQYEFARLNITYIVTSKRKLALLVDEGHVRAGTTRACRPSSACAGAATRRKACNCWPSASA
jgi:glutaminyl-tRNA synthetase